MIIDILDYFALVEVVFVLYGLFTIFAVGWCEGWILRSRFKTLFTLNILLMLAVVSARDLLPDS